MTSRFRCPICDNPAETTVLGDMQQIACEKCSTIRVLNRSIPVLRALGGAERARILEEARRTAAPLAAIPMVALETSDLYG